jgi:hypothetical protein
MNTKARYIVDAEGKPVEVILPIAAYRKPVAAIGKGDPDARRPLKKIFWRCFAASRKRTRGGQAWQVLGASQAQTGTLDDLICDSGMRRLIALKPKPAFRLLFRQIRGIVERDDKFELVGGIEYNSGDLKA